MEANLRSTGRYIAIKTNLINSVRNLTFRTTRRYNHQIACLLQLMDSTHSTLWNMTRSLSNSTINISEYDLRCFHSLSFLLLSAELHGTDFSHVPLLPLPALPDDIHAYYADDNALDWSGLP